MASNLQAETPTDPVPPVRRYVEKSSAPKGVHLSLEQLIVMWAVIAGTMVAVFFFGLFTGQEQGMKQALEGQEQLAVRLPVVNPPLDREQASAKPASAESEKKPSILEEEKVQAAPAALVPAEDPAVPTKKISDAGAKQKQETEAGFATKPALSESSLEQPREIVSKPEVKEIPKKEPLRTIAESSSQVATAKISTKPPAPQAVSAAAKSSVAAARLQSAKLERGWYVQVTAAQRMKVATQVVAKLKRLGSPGHIQEARVKGVRYFRVMAGPYKERKGAQLALEQIGNKGVARGTPFLKRIN